MYFLLFFPVYIASDLRRPLAFFLGLNSIPRPQLVLPAPAMSGSVAEGSPNSFPCHTSEKSPRKFNHCHTSKTGVYKPFDCHTSKPPPRGVYHLFSFWFTQSGVCDGNANPYSGDSTRPNTAYPVFRGSPATEHGPRSGRSLYFPLPAVRDSQADP
jgi:hypothetical protein